MAYFNGNKILAAVQTVGVSASDIIVITIDDTIQNKELFIQYLIDNNINLTDYKNKIVCFEREPADYIDFYVIPTDYDNGGILICSEGVYRIIGNVGDGYVLKPVNYEVTGLLDNLQTSNKTNLVDAINEVNGKHLYMHNIVLNFNNIVGDSQYIYLTLYAPIYNAFDITSFKEYIYNKGYFMCTSSVNYLEAITKDDETLIVGIYYNGVNICVFSVSDVNEFIVIASDIHLNNDTVTKIF